MKPRHLQNIVVKSLWVAAMVVATFLVLKRARGSGAGGYLALGIVAVMWTIFLVQLVLANRIRNEAGSKKRVERWLVIVLLALVLAALLVALFNCLAHGVYIGAGVTLLFVWVLIQALRGIVKRGAP